MAMASIRSGWPPLSRLLRWWSARIGSDARGGSSFYHRDGQLNASGSPVTLTGLPFAINHHWTKSLAASADGLFLYVGIGSNSNITERGMTAETDRAMVWQIDARTGAHKPYATGLRNPTALAIRPGSGELWAVVNERDE